MAPRKDPCCHPSKEHANFTYTAPEVKIEPGSWIGEAAALLGVPKYCLNVIKYYNAGN